MPARAVGRLPASYKKLKPGLHCDGGNLHLQITEGAAGNRRLSWIFRYALQGQKTRDMGLGSVNDVTLIEARDKARAYRNLLKEGIDPIAQRNERVSANLAQRHAGMTFDQAAEAYIRQHSPSWKNAVHAKQWSSTLATYAAPIIGSMLVADITTPHVIKVLDPIWHEKPETASRVRGRIEAILGWATVSGHRSGENPARWKDHLANLLPAKTKIKLVKHQTSLPYADMPAFMTELRQREGISALALEFAVLTCVRTADVRSALHEDIDRAGKVWIIPSFSKTRKEHKVPLSDAALAVFDKVRDLTEKIGGKIGNSEFLFPNDVTGAKLSENAMLALLERMDRKGQMTTHGCRSSFRTWALEATNFPWELAELSLGHTVGTKVERAYQRGDAFKKRIAIMQSWANYCGRTSLSANITALQRASA